MRISRVLLSLVLLLPMSLFLPISSPVHAVSGSEPLLTTKSPYALTLNGPPAPGSNQAGIDNLARVTYRFLPNGQVSYTDLANSSFIIQTPRMVFGPLNGAVPFSSLGYNSSTVEYTLTNQPVLGQTVSISIIYMTIPGSLNLNVTLSGSLSAAGLIQLGFTGAGPAKRPTGYSVFHGSEGFDWSDTKAYNPQFDKSTETLTWSLPTNFSLDPITVETSAETQCNGQQCQLTISTTRNNDLILVGAYEDSGGFVIQNITDSASQVNFRPRAGGGIWVVEEWYGTTQSVLSSDTITVTLTGSPSTTWGMTLIAVAGTNLNSPFDTANPRTAKSTTCTGWPTMDVKANDMVVATAGSNGAIGLTPDPGFTGFTGGPMGIIGGEYQIFTSSQSSVQTSFGQWPCYGGATWGMVVDIICAAGQSGCYTGGGQPSSSSQFNSVNVAGIPLPPQLADQGVIGFMFLLSAGIALGSIQIGPREKKIDKRARLGG